MFALVILLVLGSSITYLAFHVAGQKDPTVETCLAARKIQVALIGQHDYDRALDNLDQYGGLTNDFEIKRGVQAIEASVDKDGNLSLAPVSALVHTCRARNLIGPG